MRPTPHWIVLPHASTLRMDITTHGYGIRSDQRLFIGLPAMAEWEIAPADTRPLFLRGTLAPAEARGAPERVWRGPLVLPRVEVR